MRFFFLLNSTNLLYNLTWVKTTLIETNSDLGGNPMLIEKYYVGKNEVNGINRCYYVLKKNDFYGIEIIEEHDDKMLSASEYFTQSYESASKLAKLLYKGCVTLVTFIDILDDYVSIEQHAV